MSFRGVVVWAVVSSMRLATAALGLLGNLLILDGRQCLAAFHFVLKLVALKRGVFRQIMQFSHLPILLRRLRTLDLGGLKN